MYEDEKSVSELDLGFENGLHSNSLVEAITIDSNDRNQQSLDTSGPLEVSAQRTSSASGNSFCPSPIQLVICVKCGLPYTITQGIQ
ncbi:unnamed protein product [Ceratitis capitata]|uniref:(Mediterranean fruit fly) hypothetical protein n=1 Tax=Ceratitis capitata TaxID=7213 RepID=A0A811UWG8_CERCA|nr:unnamed protein product [Ceratitis capitata]CAD7002047.1 unnamed protein product [Ceratitis capitata]CAD7002048.1 unnamed protein product [Ceratitis capitata]